ncbi:hypothetical protein DWU98_16420 [Dyella monticola]|uniref:Uncharacterized protein n=1 Tax=Dyella monticola TaxID=1927958 RepID=A0A370WU55_9GAMM|nr:hypothetical protein [Dyella monticola]RDS79652.1 hypothetical protein DWU98_16420 [Dyella monticola]
MRRSLLVLCIFFECLVANVCLFSPVSAGDPQTLLTHDECVRLVRREFFNFPFSESSPMDASFIASCVQGKNFYNRSFYNCMFSAKYIDPLDCQYEARGIDRTKQSPGLAAREVTGDDAGYEAYVNGITKSVYQGQDPHSTVDPQLLKRYLTERDQVTKSLGEAPLGDDAVPSKVSASHIDSGGKTYWIVREDFTDLQLLKIIRESDAATETVFCARFGSPKRLRTDDGLCAFVINEHWNTVLPD